MLVGSGPGSAAVAQKLEAHPEYGSQLAGYVDVSGDGVGAGRVLPRLGDVGDFEAVCRAHGIGRVIVGFSSLPNEQLLDLIRISKRLGVKVSVVPRLVEVMGHAVEIDQIEGMTLLGLPALGRSTSTLALKRSFDLVAGTLAVAVCAPIMALVAAAVALTSRGPVLFRQPRVGRRGREFQILKFRTMCFDAEQRKASVAHLNEVRDGTMFKIADDPRTTRVGRFLRRTSLDELPQLLNVLRGDMSLVGPRPLIAAEDSQVLGWHRARLDLTPGVTGPWQVLGRNAIPFQEMIKLDYLYVAEWSLWNDIKLLVRTLPVVVGRRGS